MKTQTQTKDISGSYRTQDGKAQIDFGITYRNGYPEFTASGNYDGSSGQCIKEILARYPNDDTVSMLADWWGVYHLKDLTKFPDFQGAVTSFWCTHPAISFYESQAETFLSSNGLKFRATLSDSKTPAWKKEGEACGHHYRVTVSRAKALPSRPPRLVFDFWNSIADCQCRECKGKKTIKLEKPEPIQVPHPKASQTFNIGTDRRPIPYKYPSTLAAWKRDKPCPRCNGSGNDPEPIHPTSYDVLACISGDTTCPDTFADYCAEFGTDADSIQALQTFNRCKAFAQRLRTFFTSQELKALAEIS